MNKIRQIALREFLATVKTKAFLFGVLFLPAMIALMVVIMPRLEPSRMMARIIAMQSLFLPSSRMKERSILILSKGKLRK